MNTLLSSLTRTNNSYPFRSTLQRSSFGHSTQTFAKSSLITTFISYSRPSSSYSSSLVRVTSSQVRSTSNSRPINQRRNYPCQRTPLSLQASLRQLTSSASPLTDKFDQCKFLSETPATQSAAFVAPSAVVQGAVTLEEDASVFYQCVLRGV